MTNKDLANLMFPNVKYDMAYYEKKYPFRNLDEKAIVTRFAPSPTGFVHMGSLLTAFIAYKVSKDTNGVFYLRIEDTDEKRSIEGGIQGIINDLANFNISDYEGVTSEDKEVGEYGPYIQTNRKEIYDTYCKYLVENDYAYPCFCSVIDLDDIRQEQEEKKERLGYYGKYAHCRSLSIEEAYNKIKNKEPYVVRLKSRGNFNREIVVNDLVRGKITFPENDLDTILIKSDGIPVYHFAHVIDDHLMRTTHVLRGEEWLSSIPIHLQLFNLFNFNLPKFAHLGLLMKIDGDGSRRKLSKRKDPEAAVSYYHEKGIPVEAVKLYLMTIANSNFEDWLNANPNGKIGDFKFSFQKVSISGSLFDLEKLFNISKNYLSKLTALEVYDGLKEWSKEFDKDFYDLITKYKEYTISILNIERIQKKPRKDFACYSQIKEQIWYMYDELFNIKIENNLNKNILLDYINNYYDELDDKETWYNKIKDLSGKYNYAKEVKEYKENPDKYIGHVGDICEYIRLSVTSKTMTPDLYEILKLLGKDKIKQRIDTL